MVAQTRTGLDISKPLTLPCGLTIRNRLAKAALAEDWADKNYLPSKNLIRMYGAWADGGWGMVLSGNVMVDVSQLGQKNDIALTHLIPEEQLLHSWKEWVEVGASNGTNMIMQLNHPGRQSQIGAGVKSVFAKSIAPSAVALNLGGGLINRALSAIIFGTPREMTLEDIEHVVTRFALGAKMAADAGFAGVEIHGAHGYLLAQFLSAKSNLRTDDYGGTPKKRARIVVEVIEAMRRVVPKTFCIGIKLNSVDHQSEEELKECIEQLDDITAAGIDFLEVSGGSYENPIMMLGKDGNVPEKSERTKAREAFFLDFARVIRERFRHVPLMVTGGFRSRQGMEAALKNGDCDIIGLGRPSIVNSALPSDVLLNTSVSDEDAALHLQPIAASWFLQMIGGNSLTGGAETIWYTRQLRNIAKI